MAIIIREATAYDTKALEELFLLTRKETFTTRPLQTFKLSDYGTSVEGEEVWLAEDNQVIVGFISLWLQDNFIHNLFVHPDWQKRGIGSALLKKAEERLSRPIELKIAMDNLNACRFYEKKGFECVATHSDAPEPYLLYRKQ